MNDKMKDQYIRQTEVLENCFDLLADYGCLDSTPDKIETLQIIIDTLSHYPKPKEKREQRTTPNEILGSYLFASNARNAAKLGVMGIYPTAQATQIVYENILQAYSLFTDQATPR